MRTKRTRVATAVVAMLLGGLLTVFATSGPAVGFFSAGLFLDVQVESPARLLARGAAIEVPLEVTCSGIGSVDLFVSVSQRFCQNPLHCAEYVWVDPDGTFVYTPADHAI
jgi:hypothetical protein